MRMEVRCCCEPENLVAFLPSGLPYETRELDDGTFAYVAHSIPEEVLRKGERPNPNAKKKRKRKTWAK